MRGCSQHFAPHPRPIPGNSAFFRAPSGQAAYAHCPSAAPMLSSGSAHANPSHFPRNPLHPIQLNTGVPGPAVTATGASNISASPWLLLKQLALRGQQLSAAGHMPDLQTASSSLTAVNAYLGSLDAGPGASAGAVAAMVAAMCDDTLRSASRSMSTSIGASIHPARLTQLPEIHVSNRLGSGPSCREQPQAASRTPHCNQRT
jgi:hypothetical protein